MATSSAGVCGTPDLLEISTEFSQLLITLATTDPDEAIQSLEKLGATEEFHMIQRLYVISRLPGTVRSGKQEPFWKKVKQSADRLGISSKKSREQAMSALRELTTWEGVPDNSAQCIAFERKLHDFHPTIWRELAAGFTSLLDARIRLPFPKLLKIMNDIVLFRIIYHSKDIQHESTSIIRGDAHAACGMIHAASRASNILEDIEYAEYTNAGLEFDTDGWVRRISGVKTVAKSANEKKVEAELGKDHKAFIEKCQSGKEEYEALFNAAVAKEGLSRR